MSVEPLRHRIEGIACRADAQSVQMASFECRSARNDPYGGSAGWTGSWQRPRLGLASESAALGAAPRPHANRSETRLTASSLRSPLAATQAVGSPELSRGPPESELSAWRQEPRAGVVKQSRARWAVARNCGWLFTISRCRSGGSSSSFKRLRTTTAVVTSTTAISPRGSAVACGPHGQDRCVPASRHRPTCRRRAPAGQPPRHQDAQPTRANALATLARCEPPP